MTDTLIVMCARSPPAPWCCCADGKGARVWRTGVSDIVGVTSVCVTARGVRGGLARRNLCEVWAARKPSRGARRSCHIPQRASPGGGSGVQNQSKFILTCIQELREIAYRIAPLKTLQSRHAAHAPARTAARCSWTWYGRAGVPAVPAAGWPLGRSSLLVRWLGRCIPVPGGPVRFVLVHRGARPDRTDREARSRQGAERH